MKEIPKGEKLVEALASADESTLRIILRALCAEKGNQELIGEYLYDLANGENPSLKRKAEWDVQICIQCGQLFEEDNNSEDCCFHPQDIYVNDDSSVWDDWDEHAHGERDCEETRRDPDLRRGFNYECCDGSADGSEGCTIFFHRAADRKRGKIVVDLTKDDEDEGDEEDEEGEEVEDDDEGDEY